MNRKWNWPIALSLVAASIIAGFNLWFLTEYRPLNAFWELLALSMSVLAIVLVPLLTYYRFKTNKRWAMFLAYAVLVGAFTVGFVLARNGIGDSSAVVYHFGTVVEREVRKTGETGTPVCRLKVRLDDPPHSVVTVVTHRLNQQVGARLGVPAKEGNLHIPWRVYHVPINFPREQKVTAPAL